MYQYKHDLIMGNQISNKYVPINDDISYNEMKSQIKKYVENNGYQYIDISDDTCALNIYNAMFNNTIILDDNDVTYLYNAIHYKIKKDYDNMKKYYLMAIERGNRVAMSNLGYQYALDGDIENMKKYYLMVVKKNVSLHINNISSEHKFAGYTTQYCIKKCNDLDEFINCWKLQIINDNNDIVDMIIHFIDNKIVNDELVNIFINIELPSSTKHVYRLLQQTLKLNVKLRHECAPISLSVSDMSTEDETSNQNFNGLRKRTHK